MVQLRFVCLAIIGLSLATAQQDNFKCPDEFEGFYPHLYSCDKYWHCQSGSAKLKLCGNGLVFDDLDPTYTSENCDYMHNVDCGNRTDIEPAISAPNCPRLYGTFPDPEDCTGFFNCRDGLSNRYSCAPGLAFDPKDRVCKWADQVKSCKKPDAENDESGEQFKCPRSQPAGTFTKHAHPEDCRQYFVCIGGTPREYGCPLGTVFKVGPGLDDGKCSDPEDVPECANYYGDLEFDKQDLVRAGVDPEAVGAQVSPSRARVLPAKPAPAPRPAPVARPAPIKALSEEDDDQAFDTELRIEDLPRPTVSPINEERARVRSRPPPSPINSIPVTKTQQASRPVQDQKKNNNQSRFTLSASTTTTTTTTPAPTTTSATTIQEETTTTAPTEAPAVVAVTEEAKLEPSSLPSATGERQPAKVKAGEDYYYYYYYYDDDEEAKDGKPAAPAAAAA